MPIFTMAATAILAEFAITSTFAINTLAAVLMATPTIGIAFAEKHHDADGLEFRA
jgi:hypothetical protein